MLTQQDIERIIRETSSALAGGAAPASAAPVNAPAAVAASLPQGSAGWMFATVDEAVAAAKGALEEKRVALEGTKEELGASQVILGQKRDEADQLLADLIATGAEYEALLDAAELDVENLLDEISQKEVEYDEAKDREYQQWLSTSIPPTTAPPAYSGGNAGSSSTVGGITWLVPCTYTRFSSPFGYRVHPVYGDWRFHSGVDLAAPSGTPIIASRSGRVTVASYSWSGGYYVTIDHLDGYETKYLHMTHYIVSPGDYVSAGQVIGYVGSTGTSTSSVTF